MSLESLAFIGDVHGTVGPLKAALRHLGGSRHLVFLGDYVNRGPDSKAVLQTLLDAMMAWPSRVTLLRGNHDQELLDYLAHPNIARFARLGGLSTIASYAGDDPSNAIVGFPTSIPDAHLRLLDGLEDFFERDDVFASHCGIAPAVPMSRARSHVATGSHPDLFEVDVLKLLGKSVVCGHYVQRSLVPFRNRGLFAIDTGCGSVSGGPLTALLWPERVTIQFGGTSAGRY